MEILSSPSNPVLRSLRKALQSGSLTAAGEAVAEGPHLVQEALQAHIEVPVILLGESAAIQGTPAFARLASHGLTPQALQPALASGSVQRLAQVPDKLFAEIATTQHSQGIVALVRPPAWTIDDICGPERGTPLLAVLDAMQDPGNAGTIVRTAEAFGATGAVFLKGSVNPYNPKCLRSSAGSIFRLPLVSGIAIDELLRMTSDLGCTLFAASADAGLTCAQANFSGPCAMVIGAEGRGIAPELTSTATGVRIPTRGVESLNAGVAAAVLLYEAQRQRG